MSREVTPSVWMASKPVEVTATVLIDNPDWEHTLDTLLKVGKFEMRVPLAGVYNLLDGWAVAVDTVFWSPCVHEVGGEGNPVPGVKLQLPASAGVRERLKDYNGARCWCPQRALFLILLCVITRQVMGCLMCL